MMTLALVKVVIIGAKTSGTLPAYMSVSEENNPPP